MHGSWVSQGELLGLLRARCVCEHLQPLTLSQPGSAALCPHVWSSQQDTAGCPFLSRVGMGRPYLVCPACLCWILPEPTAGRGAGWPLWEEALTLPVLGFSELGRFGMVHQALGSTLKGSVVLKTRASCGVRGAEPCPSDKPLGGDEAHF